MEFEEKFPDIEQLQNRSHFLHCMVGLVYATAVGEAMMGSDNLQCRDNYVENLIAPV